MYWQGGRREAPCRSDAGLLLFGRCNWSAFGISRAVIRAAIDGKEDPGADLYAFT